MSRRNRGEDDIPLDDDDMRQEDEAASDREPSDGEDLFGADMAADYKYDPAEDRYDPELIDDAAADAPMTVQQRLAAERAMAVRDGQNARRNKRMFSAMEMSPGASSAAGALQSSPGGSELDATPDPRPRRRMRMDEAGTPETPGSGDGFAGENEEDGAWMDDAEVPEYQYDLTREELIPGSPVDKRLEQKIRRSFQQFLLKFVPQGGTDPYYPDHLRKMAEEHERHLEVDYSHLLQWSPRLADWIADQPTKVMWILNETLMDEAARRFQTYLNMREEDENELRVAVHSFLVSEPLRDLCVRHIGKLVSVAGVVTKRSMVYNELKRLWLRCAKCSYPCGPFEVNSETELQQLVGSCIECQSRGPWYVDRKRTVYRNHQKLSLQEAPGSVQPGKMPRHKEIIVTGDQCDKVRPGDNITLTGIYKCLYDAMTNARTCFPVYKTELEAIHMHRKGDMKVEKITDDVQAAILELAKSPNLRERFVQSMAPSIYGMQHVKTAIALSMMGGQRKVSAGKHRIRGDINTLIVGDPGLAKSQFLKYVEAIFPRAVYTTGKGASGVGLTAAVTRDENGNFTLEGGAMVLADDGVCLIDEFDKMNDSDRTSIHEAMEQQTISVSKAGIVATLQARCAVVAVGNPIEGRYDATRSFAQNVNLSDPILSRFDLICVLRDEPDAVKDERLADHVCCSHIRAHPEGTSDDKQVKSKFQQPAVIAGYEPIDQELLQKFIVYARQRVHPKLQSVDVEKLARFYSDIRKEAFNAGGVPITARFFDSLIRLAEASARMELRQHVSQRDIDFAVSMALESFIQTQKHSEAEELRRRLKRYITQATPLADQYMALLEKIFRDKTEALRLARPDMNAADVSLDMAEVVTALERAEMDIPKVHEFMREYRFRLHFRMEGERLFRNL